MITSVPEPTEVMPTMKPIYAPIASVGTFLIRSFVVHPGAVPIAVVEVHLQPQGGDRKEEDRTQGDADDALHPAAVADRLEEHHAEECRGHRADRNQPASSQRTVPRPA